MYCILLYASGQLSFPFLPGNLKGEEGAAERSVEDVFVRRFMFGTFHGCLANEIVIKRRGNLLIVCALMLQKFPPQKFYFLIGYTESLLSHFYKCPVKLEIQTLQEKAVYKYLWWTCFKTIYKCMIWFPSPFLLNECCLLFPVFP